LTNPLSISIGEWDFFDFENICGNVDFTPKVEDPLIKE